MLGKRSRGLNQDVAEYTLNLINETDKAIFVELEDGGEQWIPKSALVEYRDLEDGTCQFIITDQKAAEFGLA